MTAALPLPFSSSVSDPKSVPVPAPAENLSKGLKPTSQTVPFRLLVIASLAGLFLPIVLPMLCNALLPVADATVAKAFYYDVLGKFVVIVGGGGGVGTLVASGAKTLGKVAAQLWPGVVTDATPNGEGLGSAAPCPAAPEGAAPPSSAPPSPDEEIDPIDNQPADFVAASPYPAPLRAAPSKSSLSKMALKRGA